MKQYTLTFTTTRKAAVFYNLLGGKLSEATLDGDKVTCKLGYNPMDLPEFIEAYGIKSAK